MAFLPVVFSSKALRWFSRWFFLREKSRTEVRTLTPAKLRHSPDAGLHLRAMMVTREVVLASYLVNHGISLALRRCCSHLCAFPFIVKFRQSCFRLLVFIIHCNQFCDVTGYCRLGHLGCQIGNSFLQLGDFRLDDFRVAWFLDDLDTLECIR